MLLMGPTGSGKSQLAKRIYALKKARRQVEGELVEVNCATLRGDGAMSMLFGHIKGAYTGALNDRTGMLKKADKGLLFLDEIGELGLDEQAMLLRAIEEKSFFPVGSDREVKSHFQLLAGTNRDLALDVKKGLFRDDLLARIHLWSFVLPALRERPEDIEPNLEYELEQCTQTMGRRVSFTRDARVRFLRFAQSSEGLWPGNFRDFGASIRRMATLAHQGSIEALDVDEELERLRLMWRSEHAQERQSLAAALLAERIEEIDRFDLVQLEEVLRVCRTSSSLSAAGRVLFAASRATKTSQNDADRLRKYLARFQLSWAEVRGTS
jgi:transcriptional regulatory protein RtcR